MYSCIEDRFPYDTKRTVNANISLCSQPQIAFMLGDNSKWVNQNRTALRGGMSEVAETLANGAN